MPITPRGVEYADGSLTFPPGLGGVGGAFQTMAESIDTAIVNNSLALIDQIITTSSSNQVTFSDIPDNCEDLIIIWGGRAVTDETASTLLVRLNGDGGASNYGGGRWSVNPEGPSFRDASWSGSTSGAHGGIVGGQASGGWIHIPRYRRAISKDILGWGSYRTSGYGTNNSVSGGYRGNFMSSGIWKNTSVVTSVRFWPSGEEFAAGMIASLYGTPSVT